MMGFTADQVAAATGVVTIVGGGAVSLLGLYSSQVNRAHRLELGGIKSECERQGKSLEAAWIKFDELRDKMWRRDEQKEFRDEVKMDMEKLANRLESAIEKAVEKLSEDIKDIRGNNG